MKSLCLLTGLVLLAASFGVAQTTTGTWTLDPPQTQSYNVTVQQPINPDGTSVWSATKGVVPVQFGLSVGYGPVVFASMVSGTPVYSALSFKPATTMTFDQITNLSAEYTFTAGTCHGGALRWSIGFTDGSTIFIYYGNSSTSWNDCSSVPSDTAIDQSGLNMIRANFDGQGDDARYERSDHQPSVYTTYANASSFAAGKTISYVALVLDAGWGGSQIVDLGHVTVNDNTFVPLSGSATTCDLPPANIEVDRLSPTPAGPIDEVTAIQPNDTGSAYRIVDCKYMYNLAAKSLGAGSYQVKVIINNAAANGYGKFALK